MRYSIVVLIAFCAACSSALAQQSPLVRTVARHGIMQDFEISNFKYQCPGGYMPISYSFTPKFPYDQWEIDSMALTDRSGSPVNKNALSSAQVDGGGFALTLNNIEHHAKEWEALV